MKGCRIMRSIMFLGMMENSHPSLSLRELDFSPSPAVEYTFDIFNRIAQEVLQFSKHARKIAFFGESTCI